MISRSGRAERLSGDGGFVEFNADVLVLGGGPAGIWAAISAAGRGADSKLVRASLVSPIERSGMGPVQLGWAIQDIGGRTTRIPH